jgi:hypothetical protein
MLTVAILSLASMAGAQRNPPAAHLRAEVVLADNAFIIMNSEHDNCLNITPTLNEKYRNSSGGAPLRQE